MDQQKLERLLEIMLLQLLDVRVQNFVLQSVMHAYGGITHDHLLTVIDKTRETHGETMLRSFFMALHRQAGATPDEPSPANMPTDLWSDFRRAEQWDMQADLFQQEWRRLWDAL